MLSSLFHKQLPFRPGRGDTSFGSPCIQSIPNLLFNTHIDIATNRLIFMPGLRPAKEEAVMAVEDLLAKGMVEGVMIGESTTFGNLPII